MCLKTTWCPIPSGHAGECVVVESHPVRPSREEELLQEIADLLREAAEKVAQEVGGESMMRGLEVEKLKLALAAAEEDAARWRVATRQANTNTERERLRAKRALAAALKERDEARAEAKRWEERAFALNDRADRETARGDRMAEAPRLAQEIIGRAVEILDADDLGEVSRDTLEGTCRRVLSLLSNGPALIAYAAPSPAAETEAKETT